jgi:wyosine [tRNA(Phe)-imidazoG37] synthetase (radical SAM superfamily)
MKYIFGPVFSRRLGLSLGVDLVPYKVCSMDCLYCEVGPTTEKTLVRAEYVPYQGVVRELKEYLSHEPEIDYITFSGYGEPTLFSRLGELVNFLKDNYPYKLALLTNASLLHRDELLKEVERVELVLPSLDAGSEELFRKLNRPAEGLSLEKVVEGIGRLLKETPCEVWVETLFVKGVNDSREEVERIGDLIHKLKPHKWQLNTVVRPPAYGVEGLTYGELEEIARLVGYPRTEVVARAPSRCSKVPVSQLKEEIYELVLRRPCPVEEIADALGVSRKEVEKAVEELKEEGKVKEVLFGGEPYVKGVSS